MLVNVQAFILNSCRHSKTVNPLDAIEKKESTSCCPKIYNEDAEAFCPKETPTVAVESPIAC